MLVKLLELPLAEFEEKVKNEVIDNIALDTAPENDGETDMDDNMAAADGTEDAQGGIDVSAAENILYDADDDNWTSAYSDRSDMPGREYTSSVTLLDELESQTAEYDITDHQRELIEYLIGSLDDNGYIDRPLSRIADDLLFYLNIETDVHELEQVLGVLQQFDPAGIGARDLRECLLIQMRRQGEEWTDSIAYRMVADYFDLFVRKSYEKLADHLDVTVSQIHDAYDAITRLNPHPGRALSEGAGDMVQTILPDFIIETTPEGGISMTVNSGRIPRLRVSADYVSQVKTLQSQARKLTKS